MYLVTIVATLISVSAATSSWPSLSDITLSSTTLTTLSASTTLSTTINTPATASSKAATFMKPALTAIPRIPCGQDIPSGNGILAMIYDRALGGNYVPYLPARAAFRGRCDGIKVMGGYQRNTTTLRAVCRGDNGKHYLTELNLNRCLVAAGGILSYAPDNTIFDTSCADCGLFYQKDRANSNLIFVCGCYDNETDSIKPALIQFGLEPPASLMPFNLSVKPNSEGRLTCGKVNGTLVFIY